MKFVFVALAFLPLLSCSSGQKSKEIIPTDGANLFDFPGSCRHGVLSPNGQRALALCERDSKRLQIHEFDLQKKTYRQVTWQDGRIRSVDWMNDDQLVYDSNTDELKEATFSGLPMEQIGAELYASDRFGTRIDRLTERFGEDSQVFSAKDGRLLYLSHRGSSRVVFIRDQNANFRPVSPLTATEKFSPALLGRQAAWLEKSEEGVLGLRLQGRPAPAEWQARDLRSLRSVGNGWLIAEVNSNRTGSSVWFTSSDFSCERPVWLGQELIAYADASASTSRLLLTFEGRSRHRLAIQDLPANSFTCTPEAPASTISP